MRKTKVVKQRKKTYQAQMRTNRARKKTIELNDRLNRAIGALRSVRAIAVASSKCLCWPNSVPCSFCTAMRIIASALEK